MSAMSQHPATLRRLPLLLLPLAAVSLLSGLLAGLIRMGWALPTPSADLILLHGPLMVAGFFGTLIGLERAVALQKTWVYGAPVLVGFGGLTLAVGGPVSLAEEAIVIGSLIYLVAAVWLNARHYALHIAVMTLGAVCWYIGNFLWLLGWAVPDVVLWWLAFLVLTIAGERLELSRLLQPPAWARAAFLGIVIVLLMGVVAVAQWETPAWHMFGAALVCLTLWLAQHDLARHTVHGRGVARFSAICLLSGYVWLGLAGLVAIVSDDPTGGFAYDATLHAVFLGFVFAMVFGHAPIILPAVLRIAVPFRPAFYAPLGLLHVGLVLRIFGDLLTWQPGRLWGEMIDVLAILGFAGTVAAAALTRQAPAAIIKDAKQANVSLPVRNRAVD
jgi:hypothetical protein